MLDTVRGLSDLWHIGVSMLEAFFLHLRELEELILRYAGWMVLLSLASLALSALLLPRFIIRLPADYFTGKKRHRPPARHPVVHWALMLLKNLLGFVLIVAGVLMLVLPGQGLLTLLIGLMLMNYPGKFALERWLVCLPRVLSLLNRWRIRHGCRPFLSPKHHGKPSG